MATPAHLATAIIQQFVMPTIKTLFGSTIAIHLGLNLQAKRDNSSPISTPDYSVNPFLSSAGGKKDCSGKREMVAKKKSCTEKNKSTNVYSFCMSAYIFPVQKIRMLGS
jgi:hypothetical protein